MMKKQYDSPVALVMGLEIMDLLTGSPLNNDPFASDIEWEGI